MSNWVSDRQFKSKKKKKKKTLPTKIRIFEGICDIVACVGSWIGFVVMRLLSSLKVIDSAQLNNLSAIFRKPVTEMNIS